MPVSRARTRPFQENLPFCYSSACNTEAVAIAHLPKPILRLALCVCVLDFALRFAVALFHKSD